MGKTGIVMAKARDSAFFRGVFLDGGIASITDAVTHYYAPFMCPSHRHCGISWKLDLTHGTSPWLFGDAAGGAHGRAW